MQDSRGLTRRQALRGIGAAGVGLTALGGVEDLLARAAEAAPRHGSLKDIEHVVILIQENRSFDHYFGRLSGVRGFDDQRGRHAFFQHYDHGKTLHPFHLRKGCLPDISHDWGPQHHAWHGGRMDRFVRAHEPSSVNAPGIAPETMGYYDRRDLAFYYALADAFTICDGYHCSVIGPTDPNRLYSMSATLDPHGKAGGPLVFTDIPDRNNRFSWRTMPESLQDKGISWKQYTDKKGAGGLDGVLTYFKQYSTNSALADRAFNPVYPDDFVADIAADRLPQVSWILAALANSEHAGYSTPLSGEIVARQVVEALVSHPKIWRKTALFLTWDENGGFFDHVAPPTPPKGTRGEYITVPIDKVPSAQGIRGPIGLGFRVPMLVVSPFSRGGLVCSDRFDHTSMLRFLETRFRAEVPNLSHWRRRMTGDLTSAFNFAAAPSYRRPRLAKPGGAGTGACHGPTTVRDTSGPFPKQEPGRRRRPSGIVK